MTIFFSLNLSIFIFLSSSLFYLFFDSLKPNFSNSFSTNLLYWAFQTKVHPPFRLGTQIRSIQYFILNHTLYLFIFLIQKNHTITFLIDIQVMLSYRCISRFPLSITKSSLRTLLHPFINRAIREFHHQNPIDIFNPKIIIVTCTNSAQLTCRLCCRGINPKFSTYEKQKQRKHTLKKNNHKHKTVFIWFDNLPMSMELQGFHYHLDQTQLGSTKPNIYVMPNIDFVPPDFISFNINQPSQNKMYTLHDIPSIFVIK